MAKQSKSVITMEKLQQFVVEDIIKNNAVHEGFKFYLESLKNKIIEAFTGEPE